MQKKRPQSSVFLTNPHTDLLYGTHAVNAALTNPYRKHKELFYVDEKAVKSISHFPDNLKSTKISRETFIHELGEDTTHQGIALITSRCYEFSVESFLAQKPDATKIVALDQVTDPQNVGAIIRSAAAFNIDAILLTEHNSPQNLDKALAKNASGALEHIDIIRTTNLSQSMKKLQEYGFWSFAFDEQGSVPLQNANFSGKTLFIFGAEGKGLRRLTKENCDVLITLPTNQNFGTLNVSCTVAACLWEVARSSLKE